MSNTEFLRKKLRRSATFVLAAAIMIPLLATSVDEQVKDSSKLPAPDRWEYTVRRQCNAIA
jgi:hypothetical protein